MAITYIRLPEREKTLSLHTDKTLRSPVKIIDCFVLPPSVQITILVEQSTFVVESMSDLVPDHYADSAVIQATREESVVERGLQYARWKH